MHTIINRQRKQDGFTLLEVLIALLVLSIGLLGLAALQTIGLRSNQMASTRTQATQRAYDMSDRMRANQIGVDAQSYIQSTTSDIPDVEVNCATATCTATQIVIFDKANWLTEVTGLPGGRGRITRDASGPFVQHTITIFWDEERTGATGTNCGDDPDVDLRCIQITL
jgi:type IV pilus assembly protein PilV